MDLDEELLPGEVLGYHSRINNVSIKLRRVAEHLGDCSIVASGVCANLGFCSVPTDNVSKDSTSI